MIYLVDRQTYAITESRETHSHGRYIVCDTLEEAVKERALAIVKEIFELVKRMSLLERLLNAK